MISWHTHPLVSVLMVTTSPSRRALATQAVACFETQNWPLKELVIVDTTDFPCTLRSCRYIHVQVNTPGALKNMALQIATGEWCLWWDDTCWFEPDYVALHMANASKTRVTVAGIIQVCDADTLEHRVARTGQLAGFFRLQPYRYPVNGDEEQFWGQFPEKRVLDASEQVLKFVRERATHN